MGNVGAAHARCEKAVLIRDLRKIELAEAERDLAEATDSLFELLKAI